MDPRSRRGGQIAAIAIGIEHQAGLPRIVGTHRANCTISQLCAITDTLVIDSDGVYNPGEFNDSLVLGLKGTFAQAELHIIRARLHDGKLNKANRGELRFPLPVGFVYEDDKIVIDPDKEVQGAVRTVFELFSKEGTAYGVVRRFQEAGMRFPRRS